MRTTGSTMSRFDKHRAVKSSGMPHSRRDNAVRGIQQPTKIKMSADKKVRVYRLKVSLFVLSGV